MILNRDQFVVEIYNPMIEQKEYVDLVELNEGLLKQLFGKIRSLFKNDWNSIQGDSEIIRVYKELDDNLTGFSTVKLEKRGKCNKIRQELVNFATIWYEQKLEDAKRNNQGIEPTKSMKFKDETLQDSLEKCKKTIKEVSEGDSQLNRWANILMDDMTVVINQAILDQVEDEDKKNEIKKQKEEKLKKNTEINKKMEKFQNEQLKKIEQERNKDIADANAVPVKDDILGEKAIQVLKNSYDNLTTELSKKNAKIEDIIKKQDTNFGLKKIFTSEDMKDTSKFETALKMMNIFYDGLNKPETVKKFESASGRSVQAMCIGVNSFIKNCIYGSDDYGDQLPLMSRLAIVSNATVGYNLPLEGDKKHPLNYFSKTVGDITSGEFNKKDTSIKLPTDFKKNANALFNKIVKEAEKLKTAAEKEEEQRKQSFDAQFEKKKMK